MFRAFNTYVSLNKIFTCLCAELRGLLVIVRDRSLVLAQYIFYATFEQCDWVLSERNTAVLPSIEFLNMSESSIN